MIVKDKQKTIERSNDISKKIITLIQNESLAYDYHDDPAEITYLNIHVLGNLISKMCIVLERYAEIYVIEKMDRKRVYEWIKMISREYLKASENFEQTEKE